MKRKPSSGSPLPTPPGRRAAALVLAAALALATAAHAETLPENLAAGPPGRTIESLALLPPEPAAFGLGLERASSRTSDAGFGAGPAPAASSDAGRAPLPPKIPALAAFPGRVGRDFVRMMARPLELDAVDWTRFAVGAGAVGVVAVFDTRIRNSVQAHRSVGSSSFANTIRPLGTWGGLAAMGVAWVAGALSDNPELAATGADGIEAAIFSAGFVTPLLKELVGRPRPNAGRGSADIEPISRNASFPSGEATEAFTLAAVVAAHTDSVVLRGVAWGLAGLVGWERVTLNAHWASDVVAGALIGTAVGTWVTGIHRGEEGTQRTVTVMPLVGPHSLGLSAAVAW
jgi:membrane-associated phospholipid phosphatase